MATCYSSDALCFDIRRVHTCDQRQVIYDPTQRYKYKCLSVMLNTTGTFRRRVPYGCPPSSTQHRDDVSP